MNTYTLLGRILHFLTEPQKKHSAPQYFERGALVVEQGKIAFCGEASEALGQYPEHPIIDRQSQLVMPGLVDSHMHYPQAEMIGAYGEQLLEWLESYTFPTEEKFGDKDYALETAQFVLKECLRNGTTTAVVFGTVHPESVDAFFEASHALNMRNICGKVMMDRNAPEFLLDKDIDSAREQCIQLIDKWHGVGRQHYAVTPRFIPTCSPEMMTLCKELLEYSSGVYLHSHLAENQKECHWVAELEPQAEDYLDAYDRYGLVGERSVFAHGIHLSEREYQRLAESGAAIAHSPTSNLFLGSGLWNQAACQRHGVRMALATDVGAGTSFSQLRTLSEAYKVQQLQGQSVSAFQSFYMATLGSARALYLDHKIGNFEPGKEADFIVLDTAATELLKYRRAHCKTLEEELFVLATLGDDRCIRETYLMGNKQYDRHQTE